jgi:uncharacterized protein DUF4920
MIPRIAVAAALAVSSLAGADDAKSYGKPLQGLKPTPLADILAKPENGRAVRVEGKIAAVCREKGCWMELRQGEGAVHVTFEDYSFFVPKDAAGSDAVLEGKVVVKAPHPDDVKHLKGEGAGAAAAARVSIEATGVELRKGS